MTPQTTADQYRRQQSIAATTASSALRLWRRLGDDFTSEWFAGIGTQILSVVEIGRRAAVTTAMPYTGAVLDETGQDGAPLGVLVPGRFTSTAPDGRAMSSLLAQSIVISQARIRDGLSVSEALTAGGSWLTGTTLTVMADTRRQVYHADIIQRPTVTGYCRMLNPPSCARCVVLAGKWFAWNKGFDRHPRCDCTHIPASEGIAGDFTIDPAEYFGSLDKAAQDRVFGATNARAIRDGADPTRVVNVHQRGLGTASGARRFGTPSRMTVDDIYRVAGTRTNAIRLLEREGYVNYQTGRLNLPA
jgi:hypothetical protein